MLPCLLCCPLSSPPLLSASFHRMFGRNLHGMSTSGTLLTTCSSFILITGQLESFFCVCIGRMYCTTLAVPLICSFRILSLLVTPHNHLSILISFTSCRAPCPHLVAQLSDHTTELVCAHFCKPFTSVSLASSCRRTLLSISSSFPMLHSPNV